MNSPLLSDADRARLVEELQQGIAALVSSMPESQRQLSRTLVEAGIAVALWGDGEIPGTLAAQVQAWWAEHTDATNRETALRVWHAVTAAQGDIGSGADRSAQPRGSASTKGSDAFQVAMQDLQDINKNLNAGTKPLVLGRTRLIRIYYAERRRREAGGASAGDA